MLFSLIFFHLCKYYDVQKKKILDLFRVTSIHDCQCLVSFFNHRYCSLSKDHDDDDKKRSNVRLKGNRMNNYSNVRKIILISGKRKSGKDYIGEFLGEKCRAVVLHLSEPLKLEYARLNQINGELLLNSSAYKENYRKDMIK